MATLGENVFVLGGARSGKSAFALERAEEVAGEKIYLATATVLDAEMRVRVDKHQAERVGKASWQTVEEPTEVVQVVVNNSTVGVILIDCITLWLTNLMGEGRTDDEILEEVRLLSKAASGADASVVIVSNEVGTGIVPVNAMARRFRDLSGYANQILAAGADDVFLVTAGIAQKIK